MELLKLVTMTETGAAKFLPSEFVIPFNKYKLPQKMLGLLVTRLRLL
jgi:hypothetical protein